MQLEKKFNNRPNDHVSHYYHSPHTGIKVKQDYFISRACAVVGVVFAHTSYGMMVLLEKRSDKMMDEAGKIGIPCGYLDWDETLYEAMMREVYEETSLYIPDYKKYVAFDNNKQAFHVKDNPRTDKRQNVSHIYVTVFDFESSEEAIFAYPSNIEEYTNKEIAWVKWMRLTEFYETRNNYQWAFNHDETIDSALKYYNNKRNEQNKQ